MGRGQVQQPLLGVRGYAPRSASRRESHRQTRHPLRRCGPRHVDAAHSGVLSPHARCGQCSRCGFRRLGLHASTSLHPFAPPALPGFDATMGALTPARRLFVPLSGAMNSARTRAGLSASCVGPSGRSASYHPVGPVTALTHYPSASRASGSLRSGLRLTLAGSPRDKAESSSLALRTGRSPPVAPHPASRRRSYVRLQAGECVPEEDFHPSDLTHLQTH